MATTSQSKDIAANRKAYADYFVDEEVEAGIILKGSEVKSLRLGKASLQDAYAVEKDGSLWMINAYIAEYKFANRENHESRRARELLLHKKEVNKLIGKVQQKGFTLIPLKMYFNSRGIAKVKLGLCRGKRQFEKREAIKERDWKREQGRLLKN